MTLGDAPPAPSPRFYLPATEDDPGVPLEFIDTLQRAIGVTVAEELVKAGVFIRNDNTEQITREERKYLMSKRVVSPNYEGIAEKISLIDRAPLDKSVLFFLGIHHISQCLARDIMYLLHWGDNVYSPVAILRQYFELSVATHCWSMNPTDLEEDKHNRPKAFGGKTNKNIRSGGFAKEMETTLLSYYSILSSVVHNSPQALNTAWTHEVEENQMIISQKKGWGRDEFEAVVEYFRISSMLLTNGLWKLVKYFGKEPDWQEDTIRIIPQSREDYLKEVKMSDNIQHLL